MMTEREKLIVELARKGYDDNTIIKALPSYLTPKEREIALLIKTGITSREIGEKLGISRRTVEIHRSNIIKKLGIQSVRQTLLKRLNELENS